MKLEIGQVYAGKWLGSHSPGILARYVILSCDVDTKSGLHFWRVAQFSVKFFKGDTSFSDPEGEWVDCFMGAAVNDYTAEELAELEYVGHITDMGKK